MKPTLCGNEKTADTCAAAAAAAAPQLAGVHARRRAAGHFRAEQGMGGRAQGARARGRVGACRGVREALNSPLDAPAWDLRAVTAINR